MIAAADKFVMITTTISVEGIVFSVSVAYPGKPTEIKHLEALPMMAPNSVVYHAAEARARRIAWSFAHDGEEEG